MVAVCIVIFLFCVSEEKSGACCFHFPLLTESKKFLSGVFVVQQVDDEVVQNVHD